MDVSTFSCAGSGVAQRTGGVASHTADPDSATGAASPVLGRVVVTRTLRSTTHPLPRFVFSSTTATPSPSPSPSPTPSSRCPLAGRGVLRTLSSRRVSFSCPGVRAWLCAVSAVNLSSAVGVSRETVGGVAPMVAFASAGSVGVSRGFLALPQLNSSANNDMTSVAAPGYYRSHKRK
jgi:hypothetical protein